MVPDDKEPGVHTPGSYDSAFVTGDEPLVVCRVPLLPVAVVERLFGASNPASELIRLFEERPEIEHALYVASPSLHRETVRWKASGQTSPRVAHRVAAYVLRMCARPTPFGLCSGVDLISAGDATTLRLKDADAIRTRTRIDMGWLGAYRKALETRPDVREHVTYFANDLVVERGDRLFVMHGENVRRGSGDGEATVEYTPVSLRNTPAVQFARLCADAGTTRAELTARLVERFGSDEASAARLLDSLLRGGVFLSALTPSPLDAPAEQLLKALRVIAPDDATTMRAILEDLLAIDELPALRRTSGTNAYAPVVAALERVHEWDGNALQVDTRIPLEGALGREILAEVERLGEIFMRCSRRFTMQQYRDRFMERYESAERLVPLVELVDPDFGIGPPHEPKAERSSSDAGIEQRLVELALRAFQEKKIEVCLGPEEFDRILPKAPASAELPDSFELGVQIAAASKEAVRAGDYTLCPAALLATHDAGRSATRFADLFNEDEVARLRRAARFSSDDVVVAELVYDPVEPRAANVALRPSLCEYEIDVGLHAIEPAAQRIPISDLLVSLENNRFVVWSASLQKSIKIRESHLLNTSYSAPNVCRFLSDAVRDGERIVSGFEWGKAAMLPFLPRVRSGKLVLSLARWILPREMLEADGDELVERLAQWRQAWLCPKYVVLVDADNKLPLDLESKLGVELLRDQARSQKNALLLEEWFPLPDQCWLERGEERFAAEFICSVFRSKPRRPGRRAFPVRTDETLRVCSIGGEWTCAKLYLGRNQVDAFLRDRIAPLITNLRRDGLIDRWFFVRYADSWNHVRLRVHHASAGPQTREILLQAIPAWLHDRTLTDATLSTYHREIERYGGSEAIELAEELFSFDSDAVLAELGNGLRTAGDRRVACLRSLHPFMDVVFERSGRTQWLERHRPSSPVKLTSAEWDELKRLGNELPEIAPSEALRSAFESYAVLEHSGRLNRDMDEIIESLMHMHANRFGLDDPQEQRLWAMQWHFYYGLQQRGKVVRETVSSG